MDKAEAIDKVRQYRSLLQRHFQTPQVFLFGSYARDTQTEDSDIDVAVVVDRIDGDFFAVNPLLWRLRRQIDHRIEPILIERQSDPSGFLNEIRTHGIEITN
jgi:predicted nucleotidyltransferase